MRPDGVLVMAGVLRALTGVAGLVIFPRVGTLLLVVWPWAREPVVVANKRTIMKTVTSFKVSLMITAVNGSW
jgi:hypothetical protein